MDFSHSNRNNYIIHKILKSDGKYRLIEEPKESLKSKQREQIKIFEQFPVPEQVYGVRGRGALIGAKQHLGARVVLNLDIRRFFPSTDMNKFNYALDICTELDNNLKKEIKEAAGYCFILPYKEKSQHLLRLPTGAPTSPIIATIAFYPIDLQFIKLAEKYKMKYTRYVDDITFSGPGVLPKGLQKEACEIVKKYGYMVHHKKSKLLYKDNSAQIITGISINSKPNEICVGKKYKNNLRAALDKYARDKMSLDPCIKGKLAYLKQVNTSQYRKMMSYYNRRTIRWNQT